MIFISNMVNFTDVSVNNKCLFFLGSIFLRPQPLGFLLEKNGVPFQQVNHPLLFLDLSKVCIKITKIGRL